MKFFAKILTISLVALSAIGSVFAQTLPQSRLNVGKDSKKIIVNTPVTGNLYGKIPEKLNFNNKNEFTQFYRNLLLNKSSVKSTEAADQIPAQKNVEIAGDKIKFGNIYPNPAINYAEVTYETLENFKDARVTIMNMFGTSMQEYMLSSSNNKVRFNTSNLDSGIYMVQFIVDGKKIATKKLVVDHN